MLWSLTRQLENDAGNNHAKTKTYQVYIAVCSFPPFNRVMDKVLQSDTEDISKPLQMETISQRCNILFLPQEKRRTGGDAMYSTYEVSFLIRQGSSEGDLALFGFLKSLKTKKIIQTQKFFVRSLWHNYVTFYKCLQSVQTGYKSHIQYTYKMTKLLLL